MDDPLLTVKQVAKRLNTSKSHVYNLIKGHRLVGKDVAAEGSRNAMWRVDPLDLAVFLGEPRPLVGPDGRALLSVVPDTKVA
jgi:hypothetical protein